MDPSGRTWKWRVLAFSSLGHLVNDGWTAFIPVVADIANQQEHAPLEVVTLMSVGFYSSAALLSFHVGRRADKSGYHGRAVSVGIAILSLAFFGFYLALNYTTDALLSASVIGLAIVAGFGSSFYHPISATLLQTAFRPAESGKALGVNGAFGALGSSLFPPLFVVLAIYLAQPNALLVLFLLGILAALTIRVGLKGYGTTPSGAAARTVKLKEALTRDIVVLTVITAVRSISTTGVTFWLPTYLTTVKGAGIGTLLGFTLGALYLAAIPGQIVFGFLIDKFDNRHVLGVSSAGAALSTLGYVYTEGYVGVVFITLFGLFTFSSFSTLLSLSTDYAPRGGSSSANALVWGLGTYGGNVVGPALVGAIVGADYAAFDPAFVFLAVLGLIGAAATPLMAKPKKAQRVQEDSENRKDDPTTMAVGPQRQNSV